MTFCRWGIRQILLATMPNPKARAMLQSALWRRNEEAQRVLVERDTDSKATSLHDLWPLHHKTLQVFGQGALAALGE